MARKIIESDVTINIEDVVKKYFDDKAVEKNVKADLSTGNEQIKSYMKHIGKDSEMFGDYKVSISVQDKSTFNEDKLLTYLWKFDNLPEGIIKTKEYVDMDALEDAIYRGLIPKERLVEMQRCKELKEVVTLRVTKPKKKEKEEE